MFRIPGYLEPRASEMLAIESDTAMRINLWVVILGLNPMRDGNQWCFLWGKNIQEGVCGFGDSPEEAMQAFEKEMYKKLVLAKAAGEEGK